MKTYYSSSWSVAGQISPVASFLMSCNLFGICCQSHLRNAEITDISGRERVLFYKKRKRKAIFVRIQKSDTDNPGNPMMSQALKMNTLKTSIWWNMRTSVVIKFNTAIQLVHSSFTGKNMTKSAEHWRNSGSSVKMNLDWNSRGIRMKALPIWPKIAKRVEAYKSTSVICSVVWHAIKYIVDNMNPALELGGLY